MLLIRHEGTDPLVMIIHSILYKRVLFMQGNGGVNDQTVSQHYEPDIAPSERFTDKVGAPLCPMQICEIDGL
jgi:hypothetical protein